LIDIREIFKNLAYLAPTDLLELIANYSAIRSSGTSLLPEKILSEIPKERYFEDVYREIGGSRPLLFLEFGVYRGNSIRKWSQMDKNGGSVFFGFDSFVGLPEKWRQRPAGYFDTGGKVPDIPDSRVAFVKGWFNETLPRWLEENAGLSDGRGVVVHIDSDLYSAGLYILTTLHPLFAQYHVLFDDYCAGEARALKDYLAAYGASFAPVLARKRKRYSLVPMQVFGLIRSRKSS